MNARDAGQSDAVDSGPGTGRHRACPGPKPTSHDVRPGLSAGMIAAVAETPATPVAAVSRQAHEPGTQPALPPRRALRAAAALEAKTRTTSRADGEPTGRDVTLRDIAVRSIVTRRESGNTPNGRQGMERGVMGGAPGENLRDVAAAMGSLSVPFIKLCSQGTVAAKAHLWSLSRWTGPAIRQTAGALVPQQRFRDTGTDLAERDGDEPVDNPITGSINCVQPAGNDVGLRRRDRSQQSGGSRSNRRVELPQGRAARGRSTGRSAFDPCLPGSSGASGCAERFRETNKLETTSGLHDPIEAGGLGNAGVSGYASLRRGAALVGGLVNAGAHRVLPNRTASIDGQQEEAQPEQDGAGTGPQPKRGAHAAPGRPSGPSLALLCAVGVLFTITAVNIGILGDHSNTLPNGAAGAGLAPVLCQPGDHYVRCWHETEQHNHPAALAKSEVFDEIVGVLAVLGDDTTKYLLVPADVIGTAMERKLIGQHDAGAVIGVADGKDDGHALASSGAEQVALHLLGNNSCTDGLMRDTDDTGASEETPASSRLITVVDGPVAARAVTALLRGETLPEGHRFHGWTLHDFQRAAATHRQLAEFCEQQANG